MHVFVTGASGYIGRAVTQELISHGHTVLALVRSSGNIDTVTALGATPHKGDLSDPSSLAAGASQCDAVIHLAFNHDFSNLASSITSDQANIAAMGGALAGTGKPLIIASGILLLAPGKVGTEHDEPLRNDSPLAGRAKAADLVYQLSQDSNVRGMVVRIPPTVHGPGDAGFITTLISLARANGEAIYIDSGSQRWSAVALNDAAVLFRLALENGRAGATYHVVGEEGVSQREINEVIARKAGVEAVSRTAGEAAEKMGFFGVVVGLDNPASSKVTREELGWEPRGSGLLEDIEKVYFAGNTGKAAH